MVVLYLHILSTLDPSLGKIDKHSLSQQTLMELFLEGITANKEKICGNSDDIKDFTEWKGLTIMNTEVESIFWVDMGLTGTLSFQWMPPTTRTAYFSWNKLTGTVDFTCFSDRLEVLFLGVNQFHGTVDLTRLPPTMKQLYLYNNQFSGITDFSCLPKSLVVLRVSNTQLEGEIFNFDGNLDIKNTRVKDMRNN